MRDIFVDASFDWKHTQETVDGIVRGKIAIVYGDNRKVERVAIGKVPTLKQYINILELVAIARAIEIAATSDMGEEIRINSDSQVACAWAKNGRVSPKIITDAHRSAMKYLGESLRKFGGRAIFNQIGRDDNPAGHLLEAELTKEAPHAH